MIQRIIQKLAETRTGRMKAERKLTPASPPRGANLGWFTVQKVKPVGATVRINRRVFGGAQGLLLKSRPIIMSEICPYPLCHDSKLSSDGYIDLLAGMNYSASCSNDQRNIGDVLTRWPYDTPTMLFNAILPNTARH